MTGTNCPFYGRHMFLEGVRGIAKSPFLLIDQHGNQCGLIVSGYAPCWMEVNQQPVDWRECPFVKDVRIDPQ